MKRYLIVAMSLLATSAFAQDGSEPTAARTPENAARFLDVVTEQYPMTIAQYASNYQVYLSYNPISFKAKGRCASVVDGQVDRFYVNIAGFSYGGVQELDPAKNAEFLRARPDLAETYKLVTLPQTIDWSKVTSIGEEQRFVQAKNAYEPAKGTVQVVFDGKALNIYPPNLEAGPRMLLAMETLKKACDKTEGLGF